MNERETTIFTQHKQIKQTNKQKEIMKNTHDSYNYSLILYQKSKIFLEKIHMYIHIILYDRTPSNTHNTLYMYVHILSAYDEYSGMIQGYGDLCKRANMSFKRERELMCSYSK